jgi:AcrR family transcriptional regulator
VLLAPHRKPLSTGAAADPMPRAKQRTPELRDRVLLHAVDLLARDGVASFTARRIAREAATSIPAVYELFGDKAGLLREVFFEGFRLLRQRLDELPRTDDPRADLIALADAYRDFIYKHPVLAQLMFSRPFADFDPGASELRAGASVRKFIVERVCAAIDADVLHGDATDISHILVATVQGLAAADRDGRLGSSRASIDRRWRLAIDAMIAGFRSKESVSR